MLRALLILLFFVFSEGIAIAQLNGTYEYIVPGAGSTKIVFKPGKNFEYTFNKRSGTGVYKKRGKKYILNFRAYDSHPIAGSFFEVLEEQESISDSNDLKIRVFDNVQFVPLWGSVVVKDAKSDTVIFQGLPDENMLFRFKVDKAVEEIKLSVLYSTTCTGLGRTFKVRKDMIINVYLSCMVFNKIYDSCLGNEEINKVILKIRPRDANEIWIRYPQAKSNYLKFTKIQ